MGLKELHVSVSSLSHLSRYHWGVRSLVLSGAVELVKERVLFLQSIWGFLDFNQGILRMISFCPRLTTIRSIFLELCGKTMWVCTFQRIVLHQLAVPSTLKAWIGWGSFLRGKLASDRSPRSMKFPVAPEPPRAVVSTISFPTSHLIGNRKVLSLAETTSTWEIFWKGNVEVTSLFKNPG